jgi:glycosyltransferase involved in cell wall biosynthesis
VKVSGFTFVRNAVMLDYPVRESILSILPLVDEMVVNVGDSDDDTLSLVDSIPSAKIKVVTTRWDPLLRSGGRVLAAQANVGLSHCTGDWALYIQADEAVHERDLEIIQRAMIRYLRDTRVEGLLFDFVHFYANYHTCGVGRKWYRREVRVIRNCAGIQAWRDAQGFRRDGRKLVVRPSGAKIYHYGWVRDPRLMKTKIVQTARLWHDDRTVETKYMPGGPDFRYDTGGRLCAFRGTHPAVMAERIADSLLKGPASPAPSRPSPLRNRILDWVDELTGWRPGEYRNYKLMSERRSKGGSK